MLHKLYDLIHHSQSDEKKTFSLLHQVASRHADPLGLFFIYLNQLFGAKSCTVGDLFAGLHKDWMMVHQGPAAGGSLQQLQPSASWPSSIRKA